MRSTVSGVASGPRPGSEKPNSTRSEEHTSELQSQSNLVCRLLLEKKKASYPFLLAGGTGVFRHAGGEAAAGGPAQGLSRAHAGQHQPNGPRTDPSAVAAPNRHGFR